MMAKTFDAVYVHYNRNYKVMKVKIFVAYLHSDLSTQAPLSIFGLPYKVYDLLDHIIRDFFDAEKGQATFCLLRTHYSLSNTYY